MNLTNRNEEKEDAFYALFVSVFNRPSASQSPELEDHKCGNNDFLFEDTGIVRDQLNVLKSLRPHGIHPKVLKEPVNIMSGPLSIICQRSWKFREVLLTGSLTILL